MEASKQLFTGLWIGGELSPLALVSIHSFLEHGAGYQLFSYEKYSNIPEGVVWRNAEEIIPEEQVFKHWTGSYAPFADWFRWAWLYREGGFWADLDVAVIKPNFPETMLWFSLEDNIPTVSNALLKFPKHHEVIGLLNDLATDPGRLMPWDDEGRIEKKKKLIQDNPTIKERRMHTTWGDTGPRVFTEALKYFGLLSQAAPVSSAFSVRYGHWPMFYNAEISLEDPQFEDSWAVHLWADMYRRNPGKFPEPHVGSIVHHLMDRYGIRIFENRGARVSHEDSIQADVLLFNSERPVLKCDNYGTEELLDRPDGASVFNPSPGELPSKNAEVKDEGKGTGGRTLRLGLLNVFEDRHTVIPCLLSVCPIFDKILVVYHNGANSDGCIDLVEQFIREGRNGSCEIRVEPYPHDVYYVNAPAFLEGRLPEECTFGVFRQRSHERLVELFAGAGKYQYATIDSDHVYVTHLIDETFAKADELAARGIPAAIKRMGYDSIPQDGRIRMCKNGYRMGSWGDHRLMNGLVKFAFFLNQNDGSDNMRYMSLREGVEIDYDIEVEKSWFHFRKGMWRGQPPKERAREDELDDFTDELKAEFEQFVRPLLVEGGSEYANLRF